MADITFAMERDSSHSAAKKELDVRNNTKDLFLDGKEGPKLYFTTVLKEGKRSPQPACDCRSTVIRWYRRGYCFGIVSNGTRRGVSVLII